MAVTQAGSRAKPSGGLELRAWLFMRVSGVLLVFLALGHLWIMHVVHTVDNLSYDFVVARLGRSFTFWRWYDLALLGLAMLHGINGMRVLIDEHVHHAGWRTKALVALYLIGTATLALGTVVLLTFQPKVA